VVLLLVVWVVPVLLLEVLPLVGVWEKYPNTWKKTHI
jgi:hypothetical protein